MVFNDQSIFFVFLTVIFVWLGVVSFVVFRMVSHYNRLTLGASAHGLKEILEAILNSERHEKQKVQKMAEELTRVDKDGSYHVQRIGIVRFNPFMDTGGSQSFTLALLDGLDNGIVMTSLYARAGNRWYVKEVRSGKGKELELSKEEQAAIEKARGMMK